MILNPHFTILPPFCHSFSTVLSQLHVPFDTWQWQMNNFKGLEWKSFHKTGFDSFGEFGEVDFGWE